MNLRKIVFFIFISTSFGLAQLSPGDLHKSHAFLEGVENCTKCHSSGQKLNSDNCLNCHSLLKARIDAGKGLHAGKKFQNCESCHIDHQGRNFDLIYWENGKNSFNHSSTGYTLEGKHNELKCEQCHNSKNISNPEIYKDKDKDLARLPDVSYYEGLDPCSRL